MTNEEVQNISDTAWTSKSEVVMDISENDRGGQYEDDSRKSDLIQRNNKNSFQFSGNSGSLGSATKDLQKNTQPRFNSLNDTQIQIVSDFLNGDKDANSAVNKSKMVRHRLKCCVLKKKRSKDNAPSGATFSSKSNSLESDGGLNPMQLFPIQTDTSNLLDAQDQASLSKDNRGFLNSILALSGEKTAQVGAINEARSLASSAMTNDIGLSKKDKYTYRSNKSDSDLRKTMSEPSLKIRATSLPHKHKVVRQNDRKNASSVAVAAAYVTSGTIRAQSFQQNRPNDTSMETDSSATEQSQFHSMLEAMTAHGMNDVLLSLINQSREKIITPSQFHQNGITHNAGGNHTSNGTNCENTSSLPDLIQENGRLPHSLLGKLNPRDVTTTQSPPITNSALAHKKSIEPSITPPARICSNTGTALAGGHLPRKRRTTFGLLSRTHSAPQQLAYGSLTKGAAVPSQVPGTRAEPTGSSLTATASVAAMDAATQRLFKESATVAHNSGESDDSQRCLVIQQLRKKLLEKSEFPSTVSPTTSSSVNVKSSPNAVSNCTALLERTTSSPVVSTIPSIKTESRPDASYSTALAYDIGMLAHHCTCQMDTCHPENPTRLITIWHHLKNVGLTVKCQHQPGRRAGLNEIQLAHQDIYTVLFGSNPASRSRIDPSLLARVRLCRLACGGVGVDSDTAWHTAGHTAHAARLAVGCVIDLSVGVLLGRHPNGFAIVRPPGHHAEPGQAMGFCYFNSIAVAARRLQLLSTEELPLRGHRRIAILDWDVHHGNGTQTIFYSDPSVLYISLHRHDGGYFFPGTGAMSETGFGNGVGHTVNIAWPNRLDMGDAEYLSAFRWVVMPLIREFQPDIVLVSAGFDAAPGHPSNLGGYNVSPAAFGWMTYLLREHKLVLALEGGYELQSLCYSVEACVRALLRAASLHSQEVVRDPTRLMRLSNEEKQRVPREEALEAFAQLAEYHKQYWECFKHFPTKQEMSVPAKAWLDFESPADVEEPDVPRKMLRKQSEVDDGADPELAMADAVSGIADLTVSSHKDT